MESSEIMFMATNRDTISLIYTTGPVTLKKRKNARNQSTDNIYVSRVTVNGKKIENNTLTHKELTGGGEIIFEMASTLPK